MDDFKRKRLRKLAWLIPVAVLAGIAVFVLRGPHISNALKKIILPELEAMSGRKVIAQKIYINIFPLFVEAKGLKVFNEGGERILFVPRAKAYLDLSGVFSKQIKIRRLVLKEPEIATDQRQSAEIIESVKNYLEKVRETALKVKIMAVEVQRGRGSYVDEVNKVKSQVEGFDGEILIGAADRIRASIKQIDVKKEGWPDLSADADIGLSIRDDVVQIKRLTISSFGSKIAGEGTYTEGRADFRTEIDLLVDTVKKIFGLKKQGEGELRAKGTLQYVNKVVTADLKVAGTFYLQTLMELLKVKERVEGLLDIKASVKGPLSNIRGSGAAVLTNGNLFDVDVKRLGCDISYAEGVMSFSRGTGVLYNGNAKVSGSINLPVVNNYTLYTEFTDADSGPIFKLIGWDPGVPRGKVSGNLSTSGAEFNPEGQFVYRSVEHGKDILGRIREITGSYKLDGSVLSLAGLKLATGVSDIRAEGTADIYNKSLNFEGSLKSPDITDLTAPYYMKLKGNGEFTGKVTGTFGSPVVSGEIRVLNPVFEKYAADVIDARLTYKKEALHIKEMTVKGRDQFANLSGDIDFRDAKELFDLARPEFKLIASLRNADLEKFAKIFYPDFSGSGRLHSSVRIGGTAESPDIVGDGSVEQASVYNVPFDSASFRWNYAGGKLNFMKMRVVRGKSSLAGDASIDSEGNFSYTASSDRVLLSDVVKREIKGDAVFSLKTEGHGTFDNPSIVLDARMVEGRLRGKPVGSGMIRATIKDKDLLIKASLINDKVLMTAKGRIEKNIPWNADIEIQTGRYDSIISSFLKDVPEDMILSMNGRARLKGDKEHIGGTLTIGQMALSMYGYSVTNDKEIRLDLKDRQLSMEKVTLRSGDMSLSLDGGMVIGKKFNMVMEGSSSLAPFKSLSNRIGLLKGDAEFVLSATGDWDSPQLNGGVTLTNASFGLKDYPYRVSSVNGYLYMDNDRIVLQKLSGKLGGGDVDMSGIVYLKQFSFKRFYLEAGLRDISVSPSNEFNVNFGGNILYKGTSESQMISGDIRINRARYRERVEWKSWLLKTQKTAKYKAEISGLEKAALNIRITGKDNIFIDNNVARASVSADMVMRGGVNRPLLFGRLETSEGTVFFRNNDFRILHASVGFFDPNRINPVIEIASETIVKGYKIKMNLEGQLDHFSMSLASDPVLKEMDILSLLTVGQTGGELKGLEGGIGAGEATSFVTGKLQDIIEERVRTITGLDRMQIDPHVSKKTGTVEPAVTVSKRLIGDKIFVTYTSPVRSSEEQIIKIEYFLTKKISLVGLRDERGIVGGDVRFRFEFK